MSWRKPTSSPPRGKKGGATHWRFVANCWQGLGLGGMEYAARAWNRTPTWSALMDMGGFNPEAANRGVYAGLVHGIASRPKSKPKPAATPATTGPRSRTPQSPGRLRQGPGGHLPRPGLPRRGMLIVFYR